MNEPKWALIIAAVALAVAPAEAQAPLRTASPPAARAVAPKLSTLPQKFAREALATPQHCELRVGNDLRLVASEAGRQGTAVINDSPVPLRYEGPNPIRDGGRFLPSSAALDVWIAVDPRQDKSLAKGLPRNVTVMVNGFGGGSDAYPATYTCNY